MDKFGLILVSYPYTAERANIVSRSISSLARTNTSNIKSVLQITYRNSAHLPFSAYLDALGTTFNVRKLPDEELLDAHRVSQSLLSAASADNLLATDKDVTHLVFMYDDFIYNPEWLQELSLLIDRHCEATAWSVYRSSYTRYHKIIGGDGTDVLMSMHDGVGCVTKDEWQEYSKTLCGDFTTADGCTFDIHHALAREGERWATGRDYWENIAVHGDLGRQDMAVDFVGE